MPRPNWRGVPTLPITAPVFDSHTNACEETAMAEQNLTPDWILQETLKVQKDAIMAYVNGKTGANGSQTPTNTNDLTLTVLGCGTMGIAILGGILDSLSSPDQATTFQNTPSASGTATPAELFPTRLPRKFNACVRRHESAKRIRRELGKDRVNIYENNNLEPTQEADVILLCCKPQMVGDILRAEGMLEAVKGKLIISILAGVPETQIGSILGGKEHAKVVRAMPNTAAAVRESMTVVATSNPPLSQEDNSLITWIFTRIGRVVHLPPSCMDASTALCGSGPAFASLVIESLAAGAIAMGLPREESYLMAAQTVRGTTGLLLGGEHPAILRDKVSTPGGCTIGGLLVLEEGMVRGTVARAVREATVVASQLGQGKVGVNGTRHVTN
jgi:pyrroline-5-carboxylate reductase